LVFSMYGHSPYLRSHSQIRCAFFRSASSKAYGFLDVRAFALFTLTLANQLCFLSQCISKTLGFLDVRAFALSADRNTRYFVQAQYRVFLSAALLIAYAHYTTLWGSRKYLNCLIQILYFAAVFVETTLLIRFIFQADSVCNQCYKF